ncbi:MAG: hypothetical protein WCD82_17045, partial [Xanthobacteraceae bacterium]
TETSPMLRNARIAVPKCSLLGALSTLKAAGLLYILLCALPPCGNGKAGVGGLNYAGLLLLLLMLSRRVFNRRFALFLQR